jgi:plasmid stabilization system protein ParE
VSEIENREDPEDGPAAYAVRISEYAQRELEQIVSEVRKQTANDVIALAWYQGMRAAVRGLSLNPRRFAIQPDESRKINEEVRREIYRHTPGTSAVYYLFYTVEDATEDGPLVSVIHVRHASRKPLTRAEAKDIRAGL